MKVLIVLLGLLMSSGCYEYGDNPIENPPSIIYRDSFFGYGYYDYNGEWFSAPYGYVHYQGQPPYWGGYEHRRVYGSGKRFNVTQPRPPAHAPVIRGGGRRR